MILPDTSVLVAGFVASHDFHRPAIDGLAEVRADGTLIGHTIAECYAVLTGPAGIYRAEPTAVKEYHTQFLNDREPVTLSPGGYREALALLSDAARPGGANADQPRPPRDHDLQAGQGRRTDPGRAKLTFHTPAARRRTPTCRDPSRNGLRGG